MPSRESRDAFDGSGLPRPMHVLGVDGGNTKTIALVARSDGTILAGASGGNADIYGAATPRAAIEELQAVSLAAVSRAGLEPDALTSAAFSLAGADWPEDHALYRDELQRRLELRRAPVVVNDALGGLWAGTGDGVGLSVVCGTGGAVGARANDGRAWHASFWLGSGGAIELARKGLQAALRSTLKIDPPTSLTALLPEFFGEATTATLLHRLTCRDSLVSAVDLAGAAPVILDAAEGGDATARRLVDEGGILLADYALAAGRQVGLLGERTPFPLVLAGGLLRHPSRLLSNAIVQRVTCLAPEAEPAFPDLPPAAGSLLLAFDAAELTTDDAVLRRIRSTVALLDAPTLAARGLDRKAEGALLGSDIRLVPH